MPTCNVSSRPNSPPANWGVIRKNGRVWNTMNMVMPTNSAATLAPMMPLLLNRLGRMMGSLTFRSTSTKAASRTTDRTMGTMNPELLQPCSSPCTNESRNRKTPLPSRNAPGTSREPLAEKAGSLMR